MKVPWMKLADEVEKATSPVMVKVERPPGVAIGITLSEAKHEGKSCLNIDHVSLMSIADRLDNFFGAYFLFLRNVCYIYLILCG